MFLDMLDQQEILHGPHLHFEIRDSETGATSDPLTYHYSYDPSAETPIPNDQQSI